MSTGRRGRGGIERGGRGASSLNRGGGFRDTNNNASRTNSSGDPTPSPFSSRGQRGDRGQRGNAPRGNASNRGTERGGKNNWRGRGGHTNLSTVSSTASATSFNSTPHPQDDYAARLDWLRKDRPRQKERFIQEGRMNPEGPMRLSEAVKLYGACQDMCPEFERVRRIVENDLKAPEMTAESLLSNDRHARVPDEHRMVKAYQRSAAGMDVELISEIRPPSVCLKTLKYMIERTDNEDLGFLYQWLWDRTRAVRKDLRTQAVEKHEDILIYLTCFEQCARLLLICLHHMSMSDNEDYSHQQDVEQLNQTHISLKERYTDNRRAGFVSPNEAEFHAYRLILCLHTGDAMVEHEIHSLPQPLLLNRRIQTAVKILRAGKAIFDREQRRRLTIAQQNWREFWKLIASPAVSYLMACAAEVVFNKVRHTVLDTIWRAYRQGNAKQVVQQEDWTLPVLRGMLGLDDATGAKDFCESYGFSFKVNANGEQYLDTHSIPWTGIPLQQPTTLKPQLFSRRIVESKRHNRLLSAVIKGMSVCEAKTNGFIAESDLTVHLDPEEDSLFISEDSTTKPADFVTDSGISPSVSGKAGNNSSALSPFANSFEPKAPPAMTNPFQASSTRNPFGPPSTAMQNPFASATPNTNGFAVSPKPNWGKPSTLAPSAGSIDPATTSPFSISPATGQTVKPGLFDASKDTIKFNPPSGSSGPFSHFNNLSNPSSPFSEPAERPTDQAPNAPFKATTLPTPATDPSQPQASFPSSTFATPAFDSPTTASPGPFSFTAGTTPSPIPAQSPTVSAGPTLEEKQREDKIREQKQHEEKILEEQRQKRELAAQNRVKEEQARLERIERERQEKAAREARERAAIEERRRVEEEERKRAARVLEEQQRMLRERDQAYDALARNVFLGPTEGLLMQFIEHQVDRLLPMVQSSLLRERREKLAKELEERKKKALVHKSLCMWYGKLLKRKRNHRARNRRQWLKENAEKLLKAKEETSISTVPAEQREQTTVSKRTAVLNKNINGFRKPTAPASAKKSIIQYSTNSNGKSIEGAKIADTRAHVNGNGDLQLHGTIRSSVNNAIPMRQRITTLPIDRSETDWFKLRAEGLDPSKYRKRNYDSEAKEQSDQEVDRKRARTSVSSTPQPENYLTPSLTTEELLARFKAGKGAVNKGSTSFHSRQKSVPLRDGRTDNPSRIIAQARELLSAHASPANSPPQHDFSRSVPDLSFRASGSRTSFGQYSVKPVPLGKPAYWGRVSRFVPQHLYGQGQAAVRDYFNQSRGSSQADSVGPTGPLDLSSPIPTEQSYIRDIDEDEYDNDDEAEGEDDDGEADGDDEDGEQDGENEELEESEREYEEEQYNQAYGGEVLEEYDEESEEYFEEDDIEHESEPQNAQMQAGGTQDDAIELSD
ncbi:SAC3/GANP/Nin1/mts3/eIF-3 p25 family-domain-containing protein [Dendryphion nanum]|uniref:SAC3/GANP/Nin1/mts3/eIF-3 p25 family-domain-containing protein n=1 Tax=Dendryphion nanum TaxID=256645 RepID=A0A9P9DNY2_9PLEO|nr:SAC3/GANP/Nin1/mts3/eIF-3 p25 family-domain-containing protein [Dendryphion nanum]